VRTIWLLLMEKFAPLALYFFSPMRRPCTHANAPYNLVHS
jgi:hypothetical protein